MLDNSKKVLFIINGFGLGNSTRCDPVIKQLNESGYQIDVITSNNGFKYYKNSHLINNLYKMEALDYKKDERGIISPLKSTIDLPRIFRRLQENRKTVFKVISHSNYAGVITDSDYTFSPRLYAKGLPHIAINNTPDLKKYYLEENNFPYELYPQLFIEFVDFIYHRIFPSLTLCPSLTRNSQFTKNKVHYTPPFIREGLTVHQGKSTPQNILVMLSASSLKTDLSFLKDLSRKLPHVNIDVIGEKGETNGNIKFHGKTMDNKHLINETDIFVINGGASSLSEAVTLKIPCIILPFQNHAEQFLNSKQVESMGLGIVANKENITDKILTLYHNYDQFRRNHQDIHIPSNGAKNAVDVIQDFLAGTKRIV